MTITRQLQGKVISRLKNLKKTLVIIGPRQVGKTTLIRTIIGQSSEALFLDGDDALIREELSNVTTERLRQIIGSAKVVFIDVMGNRVKREKASHLSTKEILLI